ncbi:MAG: prohibitin family protein [Spirochaetales bacterium]|nr:prohibitin family protein [Spirochaetales bacterium]
MAKEKTTSPQKKETKTAGRSGTGNLFGWLKNCIINVRQWPRKKKRTAIITAIVVILLLFLLSFISRQQLWVTIEPGVRGIIYNRFGGGISDRILGEGTHFIFPGFQVCYRARVARQSAEIERVTADSIEFQDVALWLNVEFQLEEEHLPLLFREYGAKSSREIVLDVITPAVNEVTKVIIVNYPIGDVLLHQPDIKAEITRRLGEVLRQYYISVIDIDVVNIRLSPDYREIVAETEYAVYKDKQKTLELETEKKESERRILEAETLKREKVLEAEGIAEYNRILGRQSITPQLLEYRKLENRSAAIKKWDGKLPGQLGNVSEWPF